MEVLNRIREATSLAQDLLDIATKAVGCGINLEKSELLLPPSWAQQASTTGTTPLTFKCEFVWLGFSLKVTDDCRLLFTDTKMKARFKKSLGITRSIFQYIKSVYVRWRIFKVYVAPVIEWYLPVVSHLPWHELACNNAVESFQHQMLALVTGVCSSCNGSELNMITAEMPVKLKLWRLSFRMSKYVERDLYDLYVGDQPWALTRNRITLRSGRQTNLIEWYGADRKDLGDMFFAFGRMYNESDDKNLYIKSSDTKLSFVVEDVITWTRNKNAEIANIIEERRLGLRD